MIIGGAMAGRRAAAQQQQQQQQAMNQAQINQANAQANAAYQQQQQPTVVVVHQAPPPPMATAVEYQPTVVAYQPQQIQQPQYQQAPVVQGKQMLNRALSAGEPSGGGEDVAMLDYFKKQLNVTQVMCDQAMQLYSQSMAAQKKAQGANVGALLIRRGPAENMMELKRDRETKAALEPAEKASNMLVEGFKKIPNELRLRYPTEMSRVGDVPVEKLRVGSFGKDIVMGAVFGNTGDQMNDLAMARKIKENEASIQRCMMCVQEQQQLMRIVQARLDQDISNASRSAPSTPAPRAAALPPPPALMPPPPPAITAQSLATYLQVAIPHVVDEASPAMQQHAIISVPQNATVRLVRGDLQQGLGAPYNDYIEVDYNGRIGKISRMVVRPLSNVPPPMMF